MKKFFIGKAFLLATFLFIFLAAFSFMAFSETKEACRETSNCYRLKPAEQMFDNGEILWDIISKQFISRISL